MNKTKRWSVWTCDNTKQKKSWVRRGIYEKYSIALRVRDAYSGIDGVVAEIREDDGFGN